MELKPLEGIRVLDLTFLPPGGYCTVQLADLGADVIRIESPTLAGKPSLVIGEMGLSRGKRSITLDQRHERGNEVLSRLVMSADVLVENMMPGRMEARGFGYPQARDAGSKIIWCSITGFGQDGPYADGAGHDISYAGHSGLLSILARGLPWNPAAMLSVPIGAMMATTGVLAALAERSKTGEGCQLDISLADATSWLHAGNTSALTDTPFQIPESPDRRMYVCGDGRYVSVAAAEPRTWAALCKGLEASDLEDKLRATGEEAAKVAERISAIFLKRSAADWIKHLGPLGAAVNPVNTGREVIDDPHNQARGTFVEVAGRNVPANPIRVGGPEGTQAHSAITEPPTVGEHTTAVLTDAGFSAEEIERLRADGVV
ncbi:CoA transferase [Myxococcota bacterium]|nr:CoA transferase [Myxococcota bacterium]